LENLNEEDKEKLCAEYEANNQTKINVDGEEFTLLEAHLKFERSEVKVTEEKFVPGVIEPSFGIGRIVYCVLEHCFGVREKDEKRTLFNFPPVVAPYKVSVLPLIHSEEMLKFVEPLSKIFLYNK
jgi:glycyl-tRNA synthetase